MIKILERNYKKKYKECCEECNTLFQFEDDDIDIETDSYTQKMYDEFKTTETTHKYIVCPVCENKIELIALKQSKTIWS